jgi:hypothetical protein
MRSRISNLPKKFDALWSFRLKASELRDQRYSIVRVRETLRSILPKVSSKQPS